MPTVQERVTDVEFHLAQLADAQLKTEIALQELSREMTGFKDENRIDRKRMDKAWGDLANKLGTIIEDRHPKCTAARGGAFWMRAARALPGARFTPRPRRRDARV